MPNNILDNILTSQEENFIKDKKALVYWCLGIYFLFLVLNFFICFYRFITIKGESSFQRGMDILLGTLPIYSAYLIVIIYLLNFFPDNLRTKIGAKKNLFSLVEIRNSERFVAVIFDVLYWGLQIPFGLGLVVSMFIVEIFKVVLNKENSYRVHHQLNLEINFLICFIILGLVMFFFYRNLLQKLQEYYDTEDEANF